jgi:hypothetical protein
MRAREHARNYYLRKSERGAQFHGRHSRDLLAGIHDCLATPLPRLDARLEIAGMTELGSEAWAVGVSLP